MYGEFNDLCSINVSLITTKRLKPRSSQKTFIDLQLFRNFNQNWQKQAKSNSSDVVSLLLHIQAILKNFYNYQFKFCWVSSMVSMDDVNRPK